jgi:hypothetical protein
VRRGTEYVCLLLCDLPPALRDVFIKAFQGKNSDGDDDDDDDDNNNNNNN